MREETPSIAKVADREGQKGKKTSSLHLMQESEQEEEKHA
jgi:hypothetical protein